MTFHKMKLMTFSALFASVLFFGCNQNEDTGHMMLEDENTRQEVFNQIADDQDMMSEFVNHMDADQRAAMMEHHEMGGMMSGDTDMMRGIMQDPDQMSQMMNMMHDEGFISDDCLQSMNEMMDERGMHSGDHMMHN